MISAPKPVSADDTEWHIRVNSSGTCSLTANAQGFSMAKRKTKTVVFPIQIIYNEM